MPYAAELHLVNYNYQKYSTVVEALDKSDGLAVLGFFIEVGDEDNPAFQPLIDSLVNVTYPGTTLQLETPFPVLPLFPENVEEFYRYDGGLTSPGCFESVVWTVMKNPVSISEEQMAAFRQLRESASGEPVELMLQNFRPPQPLNERTVYVNDLQVGDASSIRPILTVLLLSSVLALLSQ
ncbi:carbonic anhydrase 14-like [Ptychodera flava]|uniref:carbonic anhydrase 14-like n=1 Tax=Ptychodera flava TaxID=63121 RepID=UPI00396A73A0